MSQVFASTPLGDLGAAASIISLIITLFIAYGVHKIRRSFLAKARLPELVSRLRAHASSLSGHLNDFARFGDQARYELARSQATLRSIERKLTAEHRRSCRSVRKKIARQRRQVQIGSDELASTYEEITLLVEALNEYQQDLQWR